MAGGDLAVDYGALIAASTDIKRGATELQSTLDTLNGTMQPLQAQWSGEASTAYVTSNKNWSDAIGKMVGLLTQISKGVDDSVRAYQQMDKSRSTH